MGLMLNETLSNERLKKVTVNWAYRRQVDKNWYSEVLDGKGLYYISTKFGTNYTPRYIGQTYNNYFARFIDHDWYWLNEYRGTKFFRLGSIEYPTGKSKDEMKQLYVDVESALIYEMKKLYKDKLRNVMSTKTYEPSHLYVIRNIGYRGELPEVISMRDH